MAENAETAKTTDLKDDKAVALAEKPQPAPVKEEKPVNTDIFNTCTKRCTRRTWDFFLAVRDDMEQFKNAPVRGKLTFKSSAAMEQARKVLEEQGGVTEICTEGDTLNFTGTLAAAQLVLREPDTLMFDAVKI